MTWGRQRRRRHPFFFNVSVTVCTLYNPFDSYHLHCHSYSKLFKMSTVRARAVLIGDEVHVAGNKDQWGRGGEQSSKEGKDSTTAGSSKKPVYGVIEFEQNGDTVVVTGKIEGLGENTQHGFHIHEFGDVSNVSHICSMSFQLRNLDFDRAVHLLARISIRKRNNMLVPMMQTGRINIISNEI